MNQTKSKNNSIEFLRFIFTISIVYLHILHTNIKNYVNWDLYVDLFNRCSLATFLVEAFLMIAGYFMYYSINTKKQTFGEFFKNKFFRLWPAFAFATLFCFILGKLDGYKTFQNLIFCYSIGFDTKVSGITWFVAPFFWGLMLYFCLIKNISKKYLNITIIGIVYFGLILLSAKGFTRDNLTDFLSGSMVRIMTSLGLGYLLAVLYQSVKNRKFLTDSKYKISRFIIFSIAEISTLACVINWCLFHKISYNKFIFMPIFAILIFCFVCQKGIISKITDASIFKYLGQYSYSIYVMQQASFYLLGYSFWKNTEFLNSHIMLTLLYSLLFSIAIGIMTFYIIEQPLARIGKVIKK